MGIGYVADDFLRKIPSKDIIVLGQADLFLPNSTWAKQSFRPFGGLGVEVVVDGGGGALVVGRGGGTVVGVALTVVANAVAVIVVADTDVVAAVVVVVVEGDASA